MISSWLSPANASKAKFKVKYSNYIIPQLSFFKDFIDSNFSKSITLGPPKKTASVFSITKNRRFFQLGVKFSTQRDNTFCAKGFGDVATEDGCDVQMLVA